MLSFIFAIFFSFLVATPCGDNISLQENEKNAQIESTNHQEENHTDFCTVFCTCSCCGAHFSYESFQFFNIENSSSKISEKINSFQNFNLDTISYSIWQPPKIG